MASISRDPNGTKRILFMLRGQRKCLRLGKVAVKAAQTVKARVEALVYAAESNTAPDGDTADWVAGLKDSALFAKLVKLGLVAPRPEETDPKETSGAKLGAFLTEYVKLRIDVKPATKEVGGRWSETSRSVSARTGSLRQLTKGLPKVSRCTWWGRSWRLPRFTSAYNSPEDSSGRR